MYHIIPRTILPGNVRTAVLWGTFRSNVYRTYFVVFLRESSEIRDANNAG